MRAKYETCNGAEISTKIDGKDIGLSLNSNNKTYYTMIPKELAGEGAKRSKRVWLKSDLNNAVIKFWAIVKKLKGEEDKKIQTYFEDTQLINEYQEVLGKQLFDASIIPIPISEEEYIDWLKKELKNPSELAKKTGIDAFNHFYDWMLEVPITLDTLIDNFFKLRKKPISKKEEQKTRMSWANFCKLINKKTVQEVCLVDIQKFENFIHSKNYAPATISHYLNRLAKVFNYNCDKFEDNGRLIKISKWCQGMERLDNEGQEAPEVVTLKDFNLLYNNTNLLLAEGKRNSPHVNLMMKAILIYSLNTASYIVDCSRLNKSEIDLQLRTLSTRRLKTGQVKKVAYLWSKTVSDLNKYLNTRKDKSPYVFLSRTGTKFTDSGLRKLFKKLKKRVNEKLEKENKKYQITIEFKNLRDTFATVAKDIDIDPFKINCIMGHSNKGQVDRYSKRQISNNLKEACLKVEKDYFGSNSK